MKVLETERLLLREWRRTDLGDFHELSKNPKIGPMAGWEPHSTRTVSLRILETFIEQQEIWAIVHKESRKAIGSLGLHKDKKRGNVSAKTVGYVLAEAFWGKGLMVEAVKRVMDYAFEELKLDLLSVYHYPFNLQSKRVIEKCGFRYEGTLRMASKLYDGSVYDDVCYAITREEYWDTRK